VVSGGHVKLRTAEAQRIADYLQRIVPAPAEHAELLALIKRLRGLS
jgi:hypothetical protein